MRLFRRRPERAVAGYDRLSRVYQWIETIAFGSDLMRARVALVNQLPPAKHILVLGDGDGRLLARLTLSQPNALITSMDLSPRMLEMQRRQIRLMNAEHRVKFKCVDVKNVPFPKKCFDIVVTAFFLDCFNDNELQLTLPRILNSIEDEGRLYFVDFVEPVDGLARIRGKVLLFVMHLFFRWQTGLANWRLIDVDKRLAAADWECISELILSRQMIASRVYGRVTAPSALDAGSLRTQRTRVSEE